MPLRPQELRLVPTSCDKLRLVATSCDKFRLVPTSSDKLRLVATSPDQLRPVGGLSSDRPKNHPSKLRTPRGKPRSLRGRSRTLPGGSKTVPGSIGTFSWAQGLSATSVKPPKTDPNHENPRNWTHMARYELRIRPFEAHSHFQSIANPPRPQIPMENFQKSTFSESPQNPKILIVCLHYAGVPS